MFDCLKFLQLDNAAIIIIIAGIAAVGVGVIITGIIIGGCEGEELLSCQIFEFVEGAR